MNTPENLASWHGREYTPLADMLGAIEFMRTKGTVISSTPVKLPREARYSTPADMEPHEYGFVRTSAIYVDMGERVWLNAEAYTCKGETDDCIVRIRRVDNGVEVELPEGIGYAPWRKCPFEAVLPVLHIEIVPDAE